jgi:hypothetical protein
MELHPINLRTVPADPLIEFGREVINRVNVIGSSAIYLAPAYSTFYDWNEKGIALREIERKNLLTKQIELQDVKTQHDYADILALAKIAEHGSDATVAAKAGELLNAMKPFKGIGEKDRQTRLGEWFVIIDLFTGQLSTNIAAIGATTQFTRLTSDFNTLQALIAARGHDDSLKPDYTFKDVKEGEHKAFSDLRTIADGIVNATNYPDPAAKTQITAVVADLNPRIDYYSHLFDPKRPGINLDSPQTTIEILTPLPLTIPAGAEGQVLIKVRFSTGDPDLGVIELREGHDYIKRYEDNIAPNPNAKVIAHGIGKYKGEKVATFEIRIIH